MKNSQLIRILTALDKKECRELRKWLQSPYHNQREDVVALYDYLLQGNHLHEDKFLEKERIFRKIFPNTAYRDDQLRQTIHFTLKAVEEYLVYQQFKKDEQTSKLMLARQLGDRGLYDPQERCLRQIAKSQERSTPRNERFFRNEYRYQTILYEHLVNRRRLKELNLTAFDDSLEKAYIVEKMQVFCYALFLQSVQKIEFDTQEIPQLLQRAEQERYFEEPVIKIYYYILRAVTEEDTQEHFEMLRQLVRNDGYYLAADQLEEVYKMTINYCIRKMNAGSEQFRRECFEWYRQGIEERILLVNGQLSASTYYNTMSTALKLGEFQWSGSFIEDYKGKLPLTQRDGMHHFCKAKLYYTLKRYDEAMLLLAQMEYDNVLINMEAKSMLTKMYYETDEIDALESLLESFNTYLKRKTIMGYHRSIYQNIIRYTRRLVRLNPYDKEKRAQLREELAEVRPITERDWLLQQLDRLN